MCPGPSLSDLPDRLLPNTLAIGAGAGAITISLNGPSLSVAFPVRGTVTMIALLALALCAVTASFSQNRRGGRTIDNAV